MRILCVALILSGCGDLPRPFAGNPGRQAMALSVPPPPKLMVPVPGEALLPARDAGNWAHEVAASLVSQEIPAFAQDAHPGDWTLRLSASLAGNLVTPHYALVDPKGADRGDISGTPVAASAWAQAAPAWLHDAAAGAAPQIVGLLRSVDATIKQSDPNSLYNRPARIYFSGVTGAPGDGDRALATNMRAKIPDTGDQLVSASVSADFMLAGTVRVTDEPGGQQQVEIHWLVSDARGRLAGDVAQGHDVAKGSLDHYWGDVAVVITDEAAGGVHDVITNFSGRRKDGRLKDGGGEKPVPPDVRS